MSFLVFVSYESEPYPSLCLYNKLLAHRVLQLAELAVGGRRRGLAARHQHRDLVRRRRFRRLARAGLQQGRERDVV